MSFNQRETLSSRLGFILLSAGCAIGLGNVWRFPYIVGEYGGALFVLIYLFFLLAIGLPVMVMEFSIGRAAKANISLALKKLEKKGSYFHLYGNVAIAGNYILMMFYTTITGWLFYYIYATLKGSYMGLNSEGVAAFFAQLQQSPTTMIIAMIIPVVIGFSICATGLRGGVERITKVMMLLLIILMAILAVHSLIIDKSGEGVSFYLKPSLDSIREHSLGEVIFAAMSQAFFTLSIGMGGMTIFGSYIEKTHSLTGESLRVIALDTLVALISGLIIFPACFAFSVRPNSGPGLLFVTLPNIFAAMAGGRFWGLLFFIFMGFAALTTLIAVFENIISYWIDNHHWSRKKACVFNCILIIVLSLPCIFGFNLLSFIQPLGKGSAILDLEDFLISSTIMPLGSLLLVIFCTHGFGWGYDKFSKEANEGKGAKFPSFMHLYCKWILPVIIIVIFIKGYVDIFSKL